ncbi:single-stranded-DNA-specific exonuclease RecJ, partial [Klebsiella pneumoniae]|nr:single-stranded-DNA-specific exonuclease RecJ [Klebsiella pneumoniae]
MGILALLEIAGREATSIRAQDLGFVLGPRINAAGRMESMRIGIECLLADTMETAYHIAQQLNQLNIDRRQIEGEMKQQAVSALDSLQ